MKAIVYTEFGPPEVLQLKEVEIPDPRDDEVLVRIFASTVTAGDCEQRSLKMPFWYRIPMRAYIGFRKPERLTILGMDFAEEIEAAGKNVKIYQGVTLGAKSFPLDDNGNPIKGIPRHPIVEDNVVIYAGATILGRVTIGKGSVIGGNVWVTRDLPPDSKVIQSRPRETTFTDGAGI